MTGSLDRLAAIATNPAMPVRTRVLLALLCHADPKGRAWPSVKRLARLVDSKERTVRRALSDLEESGLITCQERGRGGRDRDGRGTGMTVWTVAPEADNDAWKTLLRGGRSDHPSSPQRVAETATVTPEEGGPEPPPLPAERGAKTGHTLAKTGQEPWPKRPPEPCMNSARNSTGEGGSEPPPLEPPTLKQLWSLLKLNGLHPTGNEAAIRRSLARAVAEGMSCADLIDLVRRAKVAPNVKNPLGLLCTWLGTPGLWRDVRDGKHTESRYKPTLGVGLRSSGHILRMVL